MGTPLGKNPQKVGNFPGGLSLPGKKFLNNPGNYLRGFPPSFLNLPLANTLTYWAAHWNLGWVFGGLGPKFKANWGPKFLGKL